MAESETTADVKGLQGRIRLDEPQAVARALSPELATSSVVTPGEVRVRLSSVTLPAIVPEVVPAPPPAALTRRSIVVGLVLVALMAAFTPYNDYVVQNTPFVGNHFPIGVITLVMGMVLVVNPLLQWMRWRTFKTGELVVILSMMLVAAAVPSSGLMRYLEASVMGAIAGVPRYPWCKALVDLLPSWLVPTRDSASSIITNYMLGLDPARPGRIPILPFVIPALAWSVVVAALLGMAMFLAAIFRKQWVLHERLSFPLSTLPLELLAEPEEGRYFNSLWRNPILWAGAAIPALIYLLGGLHDSVKAVPYIKLTYDFSDAFTEYPWDQLPHYLAANRVYLSVVGLCFFIPSEVAFSLWLFLVVNGLVKVALIQKGIDTAEMEPVRGMGIYLAYFGGIVWLARRHLGSVLRGAWRGGGRGAGGGDEMEFVSYRTMVVGLLVCLGVAWVWLMAAGVNPVAAGLVLGLAVVLITLMSRVVAETGLFFLGSTWQISQFLQVLVGAKIVGMGSFYISSLVSGIFYGDLRETLMPYATTSLRLAGEVRTRERPRLFMWLGGALAAAVIVSGGTHHVLSYRFGRGAMNDEYATSIVPVRTMTDAYSFGHGTASYAGNRGGGGRAWRNFGGGVVMVAALMVGRTQYAGWPFHPVGLLLMNSWPLQVFWFSILIGWAIKQVLLRYGGAVLYRRARGFFVGLILGEILSAGVWMFLGLLTNGALRYRLLPG